MQGRHLALQNHNVAECGNAADCCIVLESRQVFGGPA
jgi:hypothetical protein